MKKFILSLVFIFVFTYPAYADLHGKVKLLVGDLQPSIKENAVSEFTGSNLAVYLIPNKYVTNYKSGDTVVGADRLLKYSRSHKMTNSLGEFLFREDTDGCSIMIVYGVFNKSVIYKPTKENNIFIVDLVTH